MKNMAQVIVSLVFAGSLALSIGACGSSGSGNFLPGTYLGGYVAGESYFPDSAGPASAGFESMIAGVIRLEIAGNGAITGALYTFADGPSGIIDDLDEDDAEVCPDRFPDRMSRSRSRWTRARSWEWGLSPMTGC